MSSLGAGHRFVESIPVARRSVRSAFRPLNYVRQIVAIAVFFGIGAVFSPACWVFWKLFGRRIHPASGQRLLGGLFRFFVGWMRATGALVLDVRGLDALSGEKGLIVAANHPGLLDAVFLLSTPLRATCVMRAGLLRSPVLCGGALIAGYVTNDSGPAMVRQSMERIRSGGNLLIFPEGTRTGCQPVSPFKQGFGLVAVNTGAPVQTVLIERIGNGLSRGVSLFEPFELPLRYSIRLGERFVPGPGESARAFTRRLETWFRGRLENSGVDIRIKDPSV